MGFIDKIKALKAKAEERGWDEKAMAKFREYQNRNHDQRR